MILMSAVKKLVGILVSLLFALFFVSIIIFVLKKQDHICINAILPSFFLLNLLTLSICSLFISL